MTTRQEAADHWAYFLCQQILSGQVSEDLLGSAVLYVKEHPKEAAELITVLFGDSMELMDLVQGGQG